MSFPRDGHDIEAAGLLRARHRGVHHRILAQIIGERDPWSEAVVVGFVGEDARHAGLDYLVDCPHGLGLRRKPAGKGQVEALGEIEFDFAERRPRFGHLLRGRRQPGQKARQRRNVAQRESKRRGLAHRPIVRNRVRVEIVY